MYTTLPCWSRMGRHSLQARLKVAMQRTEVAMQHTEVAGHWVWSLRPRESGLKELNACMGHSLST